MQLRIEGELRATDIAFLDRAIPESFSGKLAGVFGGESSADRRRHAASLVVTTIAWVGAGSIAALMFWIRIPAAITRSAAIAREREAEADALLGTTPTRSVMLYRSALALACDAEYEEEAGRHHAAHDEGAAQCRDPAGLAFIVDAI